MAYTIRVVIVVHIREEGVGKISYNVYYIYSTSPVQGKTKW